MPFDPKDPAQLEQLRKAAEASRPPPWGPAGPGLSIIPDGVPVLIAAAERRRELLREVEWSGPDVTCPACSRAAPRVGGPGHAPDCRLDAEVR